LKAKLALESQQLQRDQHAAWNKRVSAWRTEYRDVPCGNRPSYVRLREHRE
jgi:hypothetical protein